MRVLFLGDPVLDIIGNVSQEQLLQLLGPDEQTGGCVAVSSSRMEELLARAESLCRLSKASGGSAATVARGYASLQSKRGVATFVGAVGSDNNGRGFEAELKAAGVVPALHISSTGAPTATCACFVTPDGQRTMRTCLGAAQELANIGALPEGWHDGCRLLHCEGYAAYRPALLRGALSAARAAGVEVSLDLASFELVHACGDLLLEVLQGGLVDLIFCNEQEAAAVAQVCEPGRDRACHGEPSAASTDAAMDFLLQFCKVSVVTLGSAGCIARAAGGEAARVGAALVPPADFQDTLGAGDNFTAGFLHAWVAGRSLRLCAEYGVAAGTESVKTKGAVLGKAAWRAVLDSTEQSRAAAGCA